MTTYTKSFRTWDEAHSFALGLEAASHGDVHGVLCLMGDHSSDDKKYDIRWIDEGED